MSDPLRLTEQSSENLGIADRPQLHGRLRDRGPVVRVEAPAGGPAWIITDHALARRTLSDPRFAKDPALAPAHWHGRDPSLEPPAAHVRALTTLDGPDHRTLRHVHAPVFSRRQLLACQPALERAAEALFEELASESSRTGQPVDLAATYAPQYPLVAVCTLLGLSLGDLDEAFEALAAIGGDSPEDAYAGLDRLQGLVARDVASTDEERRDSLTRLLIDRARAELDGVTDDEIVYLISGLIFAGHVTTQSFLGFVLASYLGGDDKSAADPESIDRLINETLRLHPSAPFTLWRLTTTPLELAGIVLPAGAPVLIDIEGTNTDPDRFPNPDRHDPTRPGPAHLAFGDGPHVCIGAQLALLEARITIDVLRRSYPEARLAVDFTDLTREPTDFHLRRLSRVPIWLGGRAAEAEPLGSSDVEGR